MKAKPFKTIVGGFVECEAADATHIKLHMPGPLPNRMLPVITKGNRRGTPNWTWNGDTERPTLKPSILTQGEDEHGKHRCHTFVTDGKVQFLADCSHEFANQTLDLLDVED